MGADPVTIGIASAVGGALLSGIVGGKPQQMPTPQAPVAPPTPTAQQQDAKQPDAQAQLKAMQGAGQAGGAPGAAQTMLTGPGGVNPDDLTLGKKTLLGS